MENIINVSDIKKLIATAHATLCIIIHALDTKVLVGEINRPDAPVEKKVRKRRTKKEIMQSGQRMELTPKMNLEKEYQSGRTKDDLILPESPNPSDNLPEDKDPFFAKTKKVYKKREKKVTEENK